MNTFKEKYLPYAMESERKTGISAIFILAQAAWKQVGGSMPLAICFLV